jgi:predicted RNA-binding protein (virulence factor B family)
MTDEELVEMKETAQANADKIILEMKDKGTPLTDDQEFFLYLHELEHLQFARKLVREKIERRVINFVRDNAINVQLSDRAEFLTDFDKPYEPAQPVHLPRYVKKGRDARPSRNPFADNSVRKHKR